MNTSKAARIVVIGAGHAGFHAASALRSAGHIGEIHLLSDEADFPYERPPLSKDYLLGKRQRESLLFRGRDYFTSTKIAFEPQVRAIAIERTSRLIHTSDGRKLPYDIAIIATGARNRTPDFPGASLVPIFSIRGLSDVEALCARLVGTESIAIIGGGFIGLELAASLRSLRKRVTIIEAQPRLLQRAVPKLISDYLLELHRSHGVDVLLSETAQSAAALPGGKIRLSLGSTLDVDIVAAGIGIVSNDDLAKAAGLDTADGIVVDERLQTSDPAVYAIGDCVRLKLPTGELIRIESVQNAVDQAKHVAGVISGTATRFLAVPWFWSDQFDCKLQIAGLPVTADSLSIKGRVAEGSFSVASFVTGHLRCVHSVRAGADHIKARRALTAQESPSVNDMARLGFEPINGPDVP